MGSYLSIVNNTQDTWACKIGPDEAALKIAGIVVSVIGAVVSVIGTAGAAIPVASVASSGAVSVFSVSSSALATVATGTAGTVASITGSVSSFGMTVAKGINDNLISNGYVNIAPGEKHQWGKMSLSLWQQGTCVRTNIVDAKTVSTDTLYMRPIFSGATDGSNLDHEIQFWIDKFGLETNTVTGTTEQEKRHHHRHHKEGGETNDQTIQFFANGSSTYDPNFYSQPQRQHQEDVADQTVVSSGHHVRIHITG